MKAKRESYTRDALALLDGSALPGGAVRAKEDELNSMVHKLLHASSATALGRQHLFHLMHARRSGSALTSGRVLNRHAIRELYWWVDRLSEEVGVPLAFRQQWPATSSDGHLVVYGDASRELGSPGESGLGGWAVFGDTMFYMEDRWAEEEMVDFSINVLEAITLDMLTDTMMRVAEELRVSGDVRSIGKVTHVSEFTDNTAAEHSSERGKPSQIAMQRLVARRYQELYSKRVWNRTLRVASCDNDIADGLSRGGSMLREALALAVSCGLRTQRVDIEPHRRDTSWLRSL